MLPVYYCRFFSSTARAAKRLKWKELKAMTQCARDQAKKIEECLDMVPNLAAKVDRGFIEGHLHSTKRADGTVDPLHFTGVLGSGTIERFIRKTSFHWYPGPRLLILSHSKYGSARLDQTFEVAEPSSFAQSPNLDQMSEVAGSSSAQFAGQTPPREQASRREWDEDAQMYKYWNGSEWVWQEQS
ncbi:hypothetical protein B7494_g8307 [Chlorociboria aeruginascens]|nr:hypothetical protein B7494_g8307 [Chlorociboria aeruginascens]